MLSRYTMMFAMAMLLIAGVWGSALAQTEEELKALTEGWIEAFNAHDVERWLSFLTDDAAHDYVPSPPPVAGKEAQRVFMTDVFQALGDIRCIPQRMLASGNVVATEWIATPTLVGEWMGMGPTGKGGPIPHLTIADFEGDKIKRLTTYFDVVTFMVQTGLMPPPDPLPPLEPSFTLPDPEPTGLAPLESAMEVDTRWNAHDLAGYAKLFRKDATIFMAPLGAPLDRESFLAVNELYLLAFPDIHEEIVRMVDMGDGWVLYEVVWTGTNDGPYFGIPATGRSVVNPGVVLQRFGADGLILEMSAYFDNLTVLMQMGVVPAPEPSAVSPASWGEIKAKFR